MEDFSTFTIEGLLERRKRLEDTRPEGPSRRRGQLLQSLRRAYIEQC
jgi:hypothetical protein